jgi:large subunit ribosomal protein L21
MSLRRASCIRFSLIRSLLETETAGSLAFSSPNMASNLAQQPLLSLRNFSQIPRAAAAAFSTSAYIRSAAEVAQETSTPTSSAAAQSPSQNDSGIPDVLVRLEKISGPYKIQHRPVFAIVEVGGTQYKVTPDDIIITEKLDGVDVSDKIQLQRVLLLGTAAETVIGRPYIPHATVTAVVEEQFLDGKVIIFHKRRRKNSRRTKGHRQPLTTLRILSVQGVEEASSSDAALPDAASA